MTRFMCGIENAMTRQIHCFRRTRDLPPPRPLLGDGTGVRKHQRRVRKPA